MLLGLLVFFFTFFAGRDYVQESLIYKSGALLGINIWGELLLASATVVITGLKFKMPSLVRWGVMAKFLLWLFAGIALVQAHQWYGFFALAVIHILNSAYLFIAVTIGGLWRDELDTARQV